MSPFARVLIGALTTALFTFVGASMLSTGETILGAILLGFAGIRATALFFQWRKIRSDT